MGYDFAPGDFIAHVTGARVEPVADLTVAYRWAGFGMTRGTVRSTMVALGGGDVRYRDSAWVRAGLSGRRPPVVFFGERHPSTVMKFPAGEVITVPRHLRVTNVDATVDTRSFVHSGWIAAMAPWFGSTLTLLLRTPLPRLLEPLIRRLPEGPVEGARRAARFTVHVDAVAEDGGQARGVLHGVDIYGSTALMIVEAATRLHHDGAPHGVRAPAEAFNSESFLDWLSGHGFTWRAETVDVRSSGS